MSQESKPGNGCSLMMLALALTVLVGPYFLLFRAQAVIGLIAIIIGICLIIYALATGRVKFLG